jgi:hypothetical protein
MKCAAGTVLLSRVLVSIVLAGCGTPTMADHVLSASAPAQQAAATTQTARVSAVRLATDDRVVELTIELPGEGCGRAARASVLGEESGAVYVGTALDLDPGRHCPAGTTAVRVELSSRLDGRDLVVDQRPWGPAGAGAYRPCDPQRGCRPAPAGCDEDSYRLAITAGDFPRSGRSWHAVACQPPWLVMDVDGGAATCGGTSSCAGQAPRVTRWLFTVRSQVWTTVGTLPLTGGCGTHLPPTASLTLCRDLPAG